MDVINPREIVQTQVPCGFEPNGSFFMIWVQINPEVEKFDSGSRPRGQYLEVVGLNPEVQNLILGSDPEVII